MKTFSMLNSKNLKHNFNCYFCFCIGVIFPRHWRSSESWNCNNQLEFKTNLIIDYRLYLNALLFKFKKLLKCFNCFKIKYRIWLILRRWNLLVFALLK